MPSVAKLRFAGAIANSELLCLKGRATLFSRKHRQVQYHAALAGAVAAWEAYVESVIRAFFVEIADPMDAKYSALHQIARDRVESDLRRFNTPNANNSRELLFNSTGYDPINDWNWPKRGMGGPATRERLNEVLQVRHSFAHGFGARSYGWNCDSGGAPNLTAPAINMAISLFAHLTRVTDRGLDRHIKATYGKTIVWY